MSHHILYKSQFVKLKNGTVIPMILGGDNNVTERNRYGIEVRSRSWSSYASWIGGQYTVPAENVIKDIEKMIQEEKDRCKTDAWRIEQGDTAEKVEKAFGYYTGLALKAHGCGDLSADKFRSFFRRGLKNAKTIEELDKIGINLMFTHYHWSSFKYSIDPPAKRCIRTEAEFKAIHDEYMKWKAECIVTDDGSRDEAPHVYLHFTPGWERIDDILRSLKPERTEKPKKDIQVDHFFTLRNEQGYLVRYTSRGYKYAHYLCSRVKIFETEKQAEVFRQKLVNSGKHLSETWKVQRIDQKTTIRKAA